MCIRGSMRLKELELMLEEVPNFIEPNEYLEQYVTPSSIAAYILWQAYMSGDIEGRRVIDLGCGTGVFTYGASLLGAKEVLCIDLDPKALGQARSFITKHYLGSIIHYIICDIRSALAIRPSRSCTVIMNPPFGIKSRGADMDFLRVATELCDTIYSIHKYSEGFINLLRNLCEDRGCMYSIVSKVLFPIRYFLKHHRRKVYYVDAVIVKLRKSKEI